MYATARRSLTIDLQAVKPGSTVFAVVRNAATSTHLQTAIKGLANVHVLEADVIDYKSLEVWPSYRLVTPGWQLTPPIASSGEGLRHNRWKA